MKKKLIAILALIVVPVFVAMTADRSIADCGKEHGKGHSKDFCPKGQHDHKAHKEITAGEIKAAMMGHIEKKQKNGVFKLRDKDRKNQKFTLKFVKIHDPVRKVEGKGYFACTDFQVVGGDRNQLMDLDFWLNPNKKGKLVVTDTRVHKDAVKNKNGKWVKEARYTFVNDKPVVIK